MCGHSLEVNVTSSLDFYLSVAQVQLLQQLLRDNMVGMDAPEKSAEVHTVINKYEYMTDDTYSPIHVCILTHTQSHIHVGQYIQVVS